MAKAAKKRSVGRPKRADKNNDLVPAAEKKTKPGEIRKTYIVKKEHRDKLEFIASTTDKSQKDVLGEAISSYISVYEKKHGPIVIKGK